MNNRARVTSPDGAFIPGEEQQPTRAPLAGLRMVAGGSRPETAEERETRLNAQERVTSHRFGVLLDHAMDLGRRERLAAETRRQAEEAVASMQRLERELRQETREAKRRAAAWCAVGIGALTAAVAWMLAGDVWCLAMLAVYALLVFSGIVRQGPPRR